MFRGKLTLTLLAFVSILFLSNCTSDSGEGRFSTDVDSVKGEEEAVKKAKSIFYNMYLPSEMYKVFEKAGAIYTPEILNPVENVNLYETSIKAALNLGVYGVDLSYNKMFGQNQKTILYFTVIHKLSQQLGIPDNQFAVALKRMERHITDRDSLTKYATDIYSSTNRYLHENDRQSLATLIITGGWVEAMYVASKISDDNAQNDEIVERIAFQKYSLKTLISMLNTFQNEAGVNRYLLLLKALQRKYEKFDIYYQHGDLDIDTINKLISANKIQIDIKKQDVEEIKKLISEIRKEITQ